MSCKVRGVLASSTALKYKSSFVALTKLVSGFIDTLSPTLSRETLKPPLSFMIFTSAPVLPDRSLTTFACSFETFCSQLAVSISEPLSLHFCAFPFCLSLPFFCVTMGTEATEEIRAALGLHGLGTQCVLLNTNAQLARTRHTTDHYIIAVPR